MNHLILSTFHEKSENLLLLEILTFIYENLIAMQTKVSLNNTIIIF